MCTFWTPIVSWVPKQSWGCKCAKHLLSHHAPTGACVKNRSSWRRTETLQGNLRPSGAADDDSQWQGSMRTWLKLWCFTTRCSLVLNLGGWRFGWDRGGFRRDNLCRFQTEETYMKFWVYKYRREHIRVIGNGHRVGNNNGNRNRTWGMQCEVERNGERGTGIGVRGLGFRAGFGDGGHETNEYRKHETRGGMKSGMGIWTNKQKW